MYVLHIISQILCLKRTQKATTFFQKQKSHKETSPENAVNYLNKGLLSINNNVLMIQNNEKKNRIFSPICRWGCCLPFQRPFSLFCQALCFTVGMNFRVFPHVKNEKRKKQDVGEVQESAERELLEEQLQFAIENCIPLSTAECLSEETQPMYEIKIEDHFLFFCQ